MANTVDKVIKIAKGEVGYLEKSAAAYKKDPKVLDKKTAGAGKDNYTKYGRDMHKIYPQVMDFPAYWCDAFVDWCFYKAYGIATAKSLLCGNFDDYTIASAQMYKNKGAYYKSNPKKGDQVFFRNSLKICHTGLVYKVTKSNIYTVEGNTSGASGVVSNGGGVAFKVHPINSSYIDGYGRPKYDVVKTTSKTSTKKPSTTKPKVSYFKKYEGKSLRIDYALKMVGSTTTGYAYRKTIAASNGIKNYKGTEQQNLKMLDLLKQGKLIKP